MYTNLSKYILYLLMVLFVHHTGLTQELSQISLLDVNTKEPIVGATYLYGTQSGISNAEGKIQFYLEGHASMELSHLNYGEWVLTAKELQHTITQGYLYREEKEIPLYPVTVVGVRSKITPNDRMEMSFQDHLAHDGAQVLLETPAISGIRKAGAYGYDPVFRGFKYDQLNVVWNGAQSASAACPNRMDPPTSQMAPNMTERVEILKGPFALRYGTGFGGTINFVPSALDFSGERVFYGRLSSGLETNGEVWRNEAKLGMRHESYDLSFFGAWAKGSDYESGGGTDVQAAFERASIGTDLGLTIGDRQELRIGALYNRARDTDFPALPMDLRTDDTWLFNAHHQASFIGGALRSWNTTIYASLVDHLMDNLLKPLDPRMMNASTAAETFNMGGRTEGKWSWKQASLFAGADYRLESAKGIRSREFLLGPMAGKIVQDNAWQDSEIRKTGVFAEYHKPLGAYKLVLSTRLEMNEAKVHEPGAEYLTLYPETEKTQINPSISTGLTRYWDEQWQLGLWLGRAQRSAGITERFINYFPVGIDPYELVGNPQLDPEQNNQADLVLKWTGEQTALELDVFVSYLQQYITSAIDTSLSPRIPSSPGVRRYINLEDALKTGFEFSWNQKILEGLDQQFSVAYTYGKDLDRSAPLPEIAPLDLRYRLVGGYLSDRLKPQVTLRHVLEQDRVSTEFGETRTPSFTLLNVQVSYSVLEELSLSLGVNNLFNETYYEHLSRSVRGTTTPIYERGRNFLFSANWRF